MSGFQAQNGETQGALDTREIARTYPPPGLVLLQAREAGVLPEDAAGKDRKEPRDLKDGDREALRNKVIDFAREQGYRSQKEMLGHAPGASRPVGSECNGRISESGVRISRC